jgi:hypothetical protein
VDDLLGDSLGEPATRNAVLDVLERIGAPGLLRMIIFDERNIPLR